MGGWPELVPAGKQAFMLTPISATEYGMALLLTPQKLDNLLQSYMADLGLLAMYRSRRVQDLIVLYCVLTRVA